MGKPVAIKAGCLLYYTGTVFNHVVSLPIFFKIKKINSKAVRICAFFALCGPLLLSAGQVPSSVIFSEDFDVVSGGTANGSQIGNGNAVQFGASLAGWSVSGQGALHVVDYATGNLAAMIYAGLSNGLENRLVLADGVAANTLGATYHVSFDISAAVYQDGEQATLAGDKLNFSVFNLSDDLVFSYDVAPGAWTGNMVFSADGFSYVGDGTGDVIYVITSETSGINRFSGAVDNFKVSSVPEPATCAAMAGLMVLALAGAQRRRGQK
jgi:hypothetical protein